MSCWKGKRIVNRSLALPMLVAAFTGLAPGVAASESSTDAGAQAKPSFDFDFGVDVDIDDAIQLAQGQIEAAREEILAATEEARDVTQSAAEEARKHAAEQMAAARKQWEEARRQWHKQMEEAREQMRLAARSMRVVERRERLTGELSRLGMVAKTTDRAGGGILIEAVTPGSPAEKAGIAGGDVITSINGERLQQAQDGGSGDDPARRIAKLIHHNRQSIQLEYRRGAELRKATVEPRRRLAFNDDRAGVRSLELPGGWLSLELAEINPALGEYFGTSRGLLVVRASSSPEVAFKAGDVILKIGDEEPSTPRQAVRLLRSYEPGQSIPVEIIRQKKKQVLALQIPRADGH